MNDFNEIMHATEKYLNAQKVFIQNPKRIREIKNATEIAVKLFPDAVVSITEDPFQMGALILEIKDEQLLVVREIALFYDMIQNADNFDIFCKGNELTISVLFNQALVRIGISEGKWKQ